MTQIKLVSNGERYTAVVTTQKGNIYHCDYAHEPSIEEVREQWKQDRKWFVHVN